MIGEQHAPAPQEMPHRSVEADAPKRIEESIIDIESEDVCEEDRQAATDQGLEVLRAALNHLDGYIIFASTAKYLHGKAKGIAELQQAPGDFDLAVFDRHKLDEIRDRLLRTANVEFLNVEPTPDELSAGKKYLQRTDVDIGRAVTFKPFPGEQTLALKGRIIVNIATNAGEKNFAIPFEVFAKTNIIADDLRRYQETVGGLKTLSLEGLERQYMASLEKETRVAKQREQVRKFLDDPTVRNLLTQGIDPSATQVLDNLALTAREVQNYYAMNDALNQTTNSAEHDKLAEEISKLLSGFKTKIPSREQSLAKLKTARRLV